MNLACSIPQGANRDADLDRPRRSTDIDGVRNSLTVGRRGLTCVLTLSPTERNALSPSFDCRRAAPVSHQKQPALSAANLVEFFERRGKINGGGHYPAAHNGLVAGSSLPGISRTYGLWMSASPAQGLLHQKRTILRERYRELIRQFTFQVSRKDNGCGRRSKLPRSAVGLSVPPSRSCQSVPPNIGTSHTLHDVLLHRDL